MKPYLSTDQLLSLLSDERGLIIENLDSATRFLNQTNYYRFTGYARYFQASPKEGNNTYRAGVSFETISELMALDDELRIRLLVPLSELELTLRTRFARVAGSIWGNGAFYLDRENYFTAVKDLDSRIDQIRSDLANSQSLMVRRYRDASGDQRVPIWVAIEVLSFGKISWMLESLNDQSLRERLAHEYSYPLKTFSSAARSLSALRNLCAHHGQLWNRPLKLQCPAPLNKRERPRDISFGAQGIFPALLALDKLVTGSAGKSQISTIRRRLRSGNIHAAGILDPKPIR